MLTVWRGGGTQELPGGWVGWLVGLWQKNLCSELLLQCLIDLIIKLCVYIINKCRYSQQNFSPAFSPVFRIMCPWYMDIARPFNPPLMLALVLSVTSVQQTLALCSCFVLNCQIQDTLKLLKRLVEAALGVVSDNLLKERKKNYWEKRYSLFLESGLHLCSDIIETNIAAVVESGSCKNYSPYITFQMKSEIFCSSLSSIPLKSHWQNWN